MIESEMLLSGGNQGSSGIYPFKKESNPEGLWGKPSTPEQENQIYNGEGLASNRGPGSLFWGGRVITPHFTLKFNCALFSEDTFLNGNVDNFTCQKSNQPFLLDPILV